ncbi:MAG: Gfo/Idh/MocA family protein [Pirellulales bacterium]
MTTLNRREFLAQSQQAGLGLAGAAVLASARPARAVAANDKLTVAIIGLRGRGSQHVAGFAARPDCEVAYLADVDTSYFAASAASIKNVQKRVPKTVQDFRRALDDKSLDAIVVATPDHWHALATVWGCQAGKDVYVEKPASHSAWEGRKMVEAARKYRRIVELGTQNRSAPYNMSAKKYIADGKLGRIHMCRVYNQKYMPNAKALPDRDPPATLDWNMWTGPAPEARYNVNLHNGWNHFWRFSGGDIINDGVHQIDLARWLLGKGMPKTVYSVGGRFDEPGVFDSPDTQIAVWEFDDMVMTFEQTLYTPYMIKSDTEVRNRPDLYPYWPQNAERIEIYGSEGLMYAGRHGCGWQVYDRQRQRKPVLVAQEHGTFPDPEHKEDFCRSIRSRQLPSADIEEGHRSTMLCQMANISYRLGGEKLSFDAKTETFAGNEKANALLKREYRAPWVIPNEV